jgi:hypothetical protein
VGSLFVTADNCTACHNGLTTSTGEDVSIATNWRASVMANSSRDPYWQASVRRETMDFPQVAGHIEDECSICHMPMSHTTERTAGGSGRIFAHLPVGSSREIDRLAADGVSCTMCHQIRAEKLGTPESFTGGFVVDTTTPFEERPVFGPFAIDRARTTIMHSGTGFIPTEGKHVQDSGHCATCHTLYTTALGPDGRAIGRLPEQVPYLEWLHSDYRDRQSCQSCHMPVVNEPTRIASVLGPLRDGLSRHGFRGGNFLLLRMLNRYRTELGVEALPHELELEARGTIALLQHDASTLAIEAIEVAANTVRFDVVVRNLTGHKLPTAYPSRRAWLHVLVRDADGRIAFESGALRPDGAIAGNDNDADKRKFEPHYGEIRRPDQVQIYEPILSDSEGRVTTGLLSAIGYLKDTRLLPIGFAKASANPDIAVVGSAADDSDFTGGGDRTHYVVPVSGGGPYRIEAELWYQPIGYRWAHNLEPYSALEPQRFLAYYTAMSRGTAEILAGAAAISR